MIFINEVTRRRSAEAIVIWYYPSIILELHRSSHFHEWQLAVFWGAYFPCRTIQVYTPQPRAFVIISMLKSCGVAVYSGVLNSLSICSRTDSGIIIMQLHGVTGYFLHKSSWEDRILRYKKLHTYSVRYLYAEIVIGFVVARLLSHIRYSHTPQLMSLHLQFFHYSLVTRLWDRAMMTTHDDMWSGVERWRNSAWSLASKEYDSDSNGHRMK